MHTQGFPSIPFILLLPATLLHAATAPLGGCLLFIIMVRTATGPYRENKERPQRVYGPADQPEHFSVTARQAVSQRRVSDLS